MTDGQALNRVLRTIGVTNAAFAKLMGYSPSTVGRLLRGKAGNDALYDAMFDALDALGVHMESYGMAGDGWLVILPGESEGRWWW